MCIFIYFGRLSIVFPGLSRLGDDLAWWRVDCKPVVRPTPLTCIGLTLMRNYIRRCCRRACSRNCRIQLVIVYRRQCSAINDTRNLGRCACVRACVQELQGARLSGPLNAVVCCWRNYLQLIQLVCLTPSSSSAAGDTLMLTILTAAERMHHSNPFVSTASNKAAVCNYCV